MSLHNESSPDVIFCGWLGSKYQLAQQVEISVRLAIFFTQPFDCP